MSERRLKVNIIQDSYHDISNVMINEHLLTHYTFPIVDLICNKENFFKFLTGLSEEEGYEIKRNTFDLSTHNKVIYAEEVNHRFIIVCDSGPGDFFGLNIYGKDIDEAERIYFYFKQFEHIDEENIVEVCTTGIIDGRIVESKTELKQKDFKDDITDFYPYIDTEEMFKQFVESNENILVLSGEPGTGKSRLANLFMKWMLNNADICKKNKMVACELAIEDEDGDIVKTGETVFSISYVKNEEILSRDEYWKILTKNTHAMVFLDDADYCLTSRRNEIHTNTDHEKNKFLSQLLSFTDGITKNNTKFVITTNIPVDDIDTAVLRKGRTFDILKLRNLKKEGALNIRKSQGLNEKLFSEYIYTDEVPACDLGSAINKAKLVKEDGEINIRYIKEDGISILHKPRTTSFGIIG